MGDRHDLFRGVVIGVLIMMVLRGLDWLLNAPVDATRSQYTLEIGTMIICGLTAWATWRSNEKLERRLQQIVRGGHDTAG